MRINWFINVGRLQLYVGRRTHWVYAWRAERISDGHGLWLGHWTILVCWLPKRKPDAELEAELLGLPLEELRALEAEDAADDTARQKTG